MIEPATPALLPPASAAAPAIREMVYDVPVRVQAILARRSVAIAELIDLGPGSVLELDKRVGEPIEIMVNDRLIGRGELVRIDEGIGVTMTELFRPER